MSRKLWIILSVVVALAAGGAWYFLGQSGESAAASSGTADAITAHDMTMGNPGANVVFIE